MMVVGDDKESREVWRRELKIKEKGEKHGGKGKGRFKD